MDDWQVGDLALCVKGGPLHHATATRHPVAGQVVTVERVDFRRTKNSPRGTTVIGSKYLPPNTNGQHTWSAFRFIKITPPEADQFDREVIDLMLNKHHRTDA